MPGLHLRGAILQLPNNKTSPPNAIVFQYNPDSIVHSWKPSHADTTSGSKTVNLLAVSGLPDESYSLTILVDANDTIADGSPVAQAIASASGVYARLAALEMLLFPEVSAVLVRNKIFPILKAAVALFVWGAGRVVPIRVTELSITETIHDKLLNPVHAEVKLGFDVLTLEEIHALDEGDAKQLASAAYKLSQRRRQVLAAASLNAAAEGLLGMVSLR